MTPPQIGTRRLQSYYIMEDRQEITMRPGIRSLFEEICEGFESLQKEREGKLTLRRHIVEGRPVKTLSSAELISIREELNMSQGVFAQHLRVPMKTLQNWEQGRCKPSTQTALLVRMVAKYPDTLERLDLVS